MEVSDIIQLLNTSPEVDAQRAKADRFRNAVFHRVREKRCAITSRPPIENGMLRVSGIAKILAALPQIREARSLVELLPISPPNTIGEQMNFDVGHALHNWWQNVYVGDLTAESGFRLWGNWTCRGCGAMHRGGCRPQDSCACGLENSFIYTELEVTNTALRYRGHPDGLLIEGDRPPSIVMEIKTIGSSAWDKLFKPADDHRIQVHCYERATDCREALYVYIDKGKQSKWRRNPDGSFKTVGEPRVKVFHEQFDDTLWNEIETGVNEFWTIYDTMKDAA